MKKLLASMLIATVVFTVSASAQDGGGRGERIKHYLVDSLGVSASNADSVMVGHLRNVQ